MKDEGSMIVCRFGDGSQLTSVKAATIPATTGSFKIEIKTDTIDLDTPLLLSKTAVIGKAQIVLNFDNNTITFQEHQIKTKSTLRQMVFTIYQLMSQKRSSTTSLK